jgi:hypothetical protein
VNRSSDYRVLMVAIVTVCSAAAVSSVVPVVEHLVGAGLLAAGLLWLVIAVVRRERRIRARLADPRIRPAARPPAEVPRSRVGPGDPTPDPTAPTTHPGGHGDGCFTASAVSTGGAR